MSTQKASVTLRQIVLVPAGLLYLAILLAVRHPRAAKIASASLVGVAFALGLVCCTG